MDKIIKVALCIVAPRILLEIFGVANANAFGLIISVLLLWLTEFLSLAYTSLMIPVLASLFGIMSYKQVLLSFANPILFLFLSCFFLSIAFSKSGLDRRIAFYIFKFDFFSRTTNRLLYTCIGLAWLLSMWISNTAACAILIPIVQSIYKDLRNTTDNENTFKKLLIGLAYGASIGGMCTPVGSPPNLLALATLNKLGYEITFVKWVLIALPISLFMLGLLVLLLNLLLKDKNLLIDNSKFSHNYSLLGKASNEEVITFISFTITLVLWIFPSFLPYIASFASLTLPSLSLSEGGLIGTAILFVYSLKGNNSSKRPLLDWDSVKNKVDWGVIILFGGGLCLGAIIDATGVGATLSHGLSNGDYGVIQICLLVTFLGIFLSELGSNTASAAILLPIIVTLPIPHIDQALLPLYILCASFGASFGFMLPTPIV